MSALDDECWSCGFLIFESDDYLTVTVELQQNIYRLHKHCALEELSQRIDATEDEKNLILRKRQEEQRAAAAKKAKEDNK